MPKRKVYLDYNATAPVSGEVQKAIIEDLALYGNASSMHEAGRQARVRVEEARRNVAALAGAKAGDIIFTSGGSESNNTVFETVRRFVTEPALAKEYKLQAGRNEVITTEIEHPCVLNAAKYLKSIGVLVHFLPVDENGKIKMDEYRKVLSERTLLVSVMFANNEIGTIQNIAEIARLAKEAGAWFHTDAVQAAGKIPVDVNALKIDYATFSGHKIYGPKGVGALYRRQGAPLLPLIHGGHQEDGFRAGTYNNIGILGYSAAAKAAKEKLTDYGKTMAALRDRLKNGLMERVPTIKVNGHPVDVLPNTLNVSFPGAEGEAILLSLDMQGIEASTGSACASGSLDPSHVLMAIGVWPELAHGSIRFSLGWGITETDIDYVLDVLPPIIKRLR
ncbi:MAG: aminotransferase class V-fold PLP-dependent enzyme, partial [Spirochaetaceae bacterium]|nr:aminotransferase class V-fold PLP-dependent enzyme [Spirochaetaceae bacterium]